MEEPRTTTAAPRPSESPVAMTVFWFAMFHPRSWGLQPGISMGILCLMLWRSQWISFRISFCQLRLARTRAALLQPRRIGAPNGAPVAPPSTISSTASMCEESSEAKKRTVLASSSRSPQRPSGITEEANFASLVDSSPETEARDPRLPNRSLGRVRRDDLHPNVAR